jgi:high-affinity iron transporter
LLPALIITLREGVEASLIIGIIAAFLVKEGHRDALGRMWLGVGLAVALCMAVAVLLRVIDSELPERQQEQLATIISLIAVAAVTYMIVWMRRNARGLRKTLERGASSALVEGTALALIGMAFLAVLREGFETAVFLLAVFQDSTDTVAAGIGAVLGLFGAVAIGVAVYRGGTKLNLTRFFRITGLVLVFVAAGLLTTSLHTAHEAGWFNSLQGQAVNLDGFVEPGTVHGALLTGMLGLQPKPTVGEAIIWLAYAVPMCLYVAWPDRWRWRRRPITAATSAPVAGGAS